MTNPATRPRFASGYPILVRSAAMTKSQVDIRPAPPATAAPWICAIVMRRVWLSASKRFRHQLRGLMGAFGDRGFV